MPFGIKNLDALLRNMNLYATPDIHRMMSNYMDEFRIDYSEFSIPESIRNLKHEIHYQESLQDLKETDIPKLIAQIIKALSIQDVLRDVGIESSIAGGFARDLHFGLKPKDLDILVAVNENNNIPFDELEKIVGKNNYKWDCKYTSDSKETQDRLKVVIKDMDLNIDIIFWEKGSVLEIIQEFDYNLNQFKTSVEIINNRLFIMTEFIGDFLPSENLVPIRNTSVRLSRIEKFHSKWNILKASKRFDNFRRVQYLEIPLEGYLSI